MNIVPLQGKPPHFEVLFGSTNSQQPKMYKRFHMPSVTDTFTYQTGEQTAVQSLLGSGQVFGKVGEILDRAKSSVMVDIYSLQSPVLYPGRSSLPGTPGASIQSGLVDKLIQLKKNGLNVKVIIDNHWDSRDNAGQNDRTIAYLRKNGVDVVTYPDFSKISHVKVLIVDNRFAVMGGMNWGNHSPSNHDAAVFIEGPDVRNIYNKVFKPDWVSSGRKASEIPDVKPFQDGKIKVLQTSSKESAQGAKDEIFREILHQISHAKESIFAELFVLTQPEIVDSLIFAHKRLTAAGQEGVKILVDPGLFFSFSQTRRGVQRLARAGVPIQFFEANRNTEEKLHSKWAVFDQKKVLIGSANWSIVGLLTNGNADAGNSSFLQRISRSNHEIALLIDSEKMGRNFANQVRYDWEHAAFPIMEFKNNRWKPIRPDLPINSDDRGSPKSEPPQSKFA